MAAAEAVFPSTGRRATTLKGAGAVIDKDFASELLAESLDADALIILTAVEKVAINFGKPDQKWLDHLTPEEARQYEAEGQFAPGSMLPKVQAAVKFAASKPGRTALITLLERPRTASPEKPAPPSPCKIQKVNLSIFYKESEKTLSLFVFFVLLLCTLPKVDLFRSVFFGLSA